MGERIAPTGFIDIPKSEVLKRLSAGVPEQLELNPLGISPNILREIKNLKESESFIPLDPAVKAQFSEIVIRSGWDPFEGADDFANEPLASPDNEKVRDFYQQAFRMLPLLGFTEEQMKFGMDPKDVSKTVYLPDDSGLFHVRIVDARDSNNQSKQEFKSIMLKGIAEMTKEVFLVVTNTGLASYWEAPPKNEGRINGDESSNVKFVLEGIEKSMGLLRWGLWKNVVSLYPKVSTV